VTAGDVPHDPRWVELVGAHNVRDLAGLPATDGRRVRPGVLLRGDHLDDLTDADLAVLRDAVGLRAIVDLRTAREAPEPRAWVGSLGLARLHLPLVDLSGTTDPRQLRREFGDDIANTYRRMLEVAAPGLVRILEFLVEDDHAPALVHCAAGKDRTGITVAVLLAAAGVEEPGIVADYVATGERLDRVRAALARRALYRHVQDDRAPVARLSGAGIEGVLDTVRAHQGGATGFLVAHGADPRAVATWQAMLLEPAT
jgi:protein-tyrosine phosphatase